MALDPITITINGVEYVCTKKEPKQDPKPDPFDIQDTDRYYWISYNGKICSYIQYGKENDCIPIANACKDYLLIKQRALHEILDRLLWRASIQAGELENPWDCYHDHWEIYCTCDGKFEVARSCYDKYCSVYFPTEELAKSALDNIVKPFVAEHPDFVW